MDVISVANQINERIKRLEELCAELDEAGQKKADAIALYDLTYAKAMAQIGLSKVNVIDGEQLPDNRPATILGKYAAGLCWKEKAEVEIATNEYKSLTTKIDCLLATINAKQSIFRHLSHEVK